MTQSMQDIITPPLVSRLLQIPFMCNDFRHILRKFTVDDYYLLRVSKFGQTRAITGSSKSQKSTVTQPISLN